MQSMRGDSGPHLQSHIVHPIPMTSMQQQPKQTMGQMEHMAMQGQQGKGGMMGQESKGETKGEHAHVEGQGLMHPYLKDPAKMTHLVQKCSEALAACMTCEDQAIESGMDCYKECKECSMMLATSMRALTSCTPHCMDIVNLSVKLAQNCSQKCSQHKDDFCKSCSTKCGEWATEANRVLKECGGKMP